MIGIAEAMPLIRTERFTPGAKDDLSRKPIYRR